MTSFRYFSLLQLLCALWFCAPAFAAIPGAIPEDNGSAVILAYSRIGEDAYPDNDITIDQFLSHVEEIEKGDYHVMPLPAIIEALKNKQNLPPRTIAITFDGAFKSALVNAIPVLLEKKIPFAVFYAADNAEGGSPEYMDWADLKYLGARENVSLGILPSSYARLGAGPEDEIRRQINKARQRHRDMTGGEAAFFSYPFGEYSKAYKQIVSESGFKAAFGLQSGVASSSSDFYALPRFTMTEKYGDVDRFRTAALALPLPAQDIEPQDSYLKGDTPVIGFSVPDSLTAGLNGISCFISGEPEPEVEIIANRVEIRPKEPLDEDRVRVNCTMPGSVDPDDDSQLYRWFGMLLVTPGTDAASPQPDVPQ